MYYYWYLYLKQNTDYQETCANGGKGPCAKLYDDFGDIYNVDFKAWWIDRRHLFAEPPSVWPQKTTQGLSTARTANFTVDLTKKRSRILDEMRSLLTVMQDDSEQDRVESAARYPVATNPVLHSLQAHLVTWELRKMNPDVHPAQIADMAGVSVNHVVNGVTVEIARINKIDVEPIVSEIRLRKLKAVSRHLKSAEQYISNAGRGVFPVRHSR